MLVALTPLVAKDRHCVFRLHVEANPRDSTVFATSVPAKFSGKDIAIERTPRISEQDVVAFYPYRRLTNVTARSFNSTITDVSRSILSASNAVAVWFLYLSTGGLLPSCKSTSACPTARSTSLPG